MSRPRNCRRICKKPSSNYFKPRGIPLSDLELVNLTFDELEAVRLADMEGLYQEAAAQQMNVSRQTFGRIIESAHKKIADALVNGKALSIEGGHIEIDNSNVNTSENDLLRESCGHSRHKHKQVKRE